MPAATVSRRTAGEGVGHTARMYVSEESHCGVVPMNHSNKDRTSSAESEEGRLRIEENTFPPDTYRLRAGLRVSQGWASVRTGSTLGRYSSEIRTGCANERPSGSVRGAPGNWCPYRDRQLCHGDGFSLFIRSAGHYPFTHAKPHFAVHPACMLTN